MRINPLRNPILDFLFRLENSKVTTEQWEDFARLLEAAGMRSKAVSVRIARQYSVFRPLAQSDVMKIPEHIRGYGIAGSLDQHKDYEYLENLFRRAVLDRAGLVQAIEGWISNDPCKLAASYYEKQPFCPDQWVKTIIETALWGDSLRAAAKIALIEKKHTDWAFDLIRNRPIGDPSNAVTDLFFGHAILNSNYIIDIIVNDKIGCPSSAAARMRERKYISYEEFREIVNAAKTGDPAKTVQTSELCADRNFAENIAVRDMTESAPRLAIWMATNKGSDPKWALSVVEKSKFGHKIDYLAREILQDSIENPDLYKKSPF